MNEKRYEQISAPFRKHNFMFRLILAGNKLLTLAGYLAYPMMILLFIYHKDPKGLVYVIVPGISFVILSLYRTKKDSPRPYESLNIDPLIHKNTKGHSFPSRHTFSMFLIASCWLGVNLTIGIVLCCFGICLALIRVIGGVHFPKDVLWGAIIGIFCGFLTIMISFLI